MESVKLTPKIEEAMRYWSNNIKEMLNFEFGQDKVGHILVIFPFGDDVSSSWISDARRDSVVQMLRLLADHIESPDARIIRPH